MDVISLETDADVTSDSEDEQISAMPQRLRTATRVRDNPCGSEILSLDSQKSTSDTSYDNAIRRLEGITGSVLTPATCATLSAFFFVLNNDISPGEPHPLLLGAASGELSDDALRDMADTIDSGLSGALEGGLQSATEVPTAEDFTDTRSSSRKSTEDPSTMERRHLSYSRHRSPRAPIEHTMRPANKLPPQAHPTYYSSHRRAKDVPDDGSVDPDPERIKIDPAYPASDRRADTRASVYQYSVFKPPYESLDNPASVLPPDSGSDAPGPMPVAASNRGIYAGLIMTEQKSIVLPWPHHLHDDIWSSIEDRKALLGFPSRYLASRGQVETRGGRIRLGGSGNEEDMEGASACGAVKTS